MTTQPLGDAALIAADAKPASVPKLMPLVISAPFGNYVQPEGCTPTLGTFTALARPGRVWRVLRTVRYYRRLGAWVNKIGLRNPGIDWLCERVERGKVEAGDKLVSVHGFTDGEWGALLGKVERIGPLGVELNMSCPNVGEVDWPEDLFARAVATGVPVVVKLPPVNYQEMLEQAVEAGVRCFHCCNTLPVPAGGVSGKPLKPVALACVRVVSARLAQAVGDGLVIGGGGITTPRDVEEYAAAGAHRFAVGTRVMTPVALVSDGRVRALREAATAQVAGRAS